LVSQSEFTMMTRRMPVLFVGHGSPINAIEENEFNQTWKRIGQELPKPKAILAISAHWQTDISMVTGLKTPETIHDFWGFPQPLFDLQYPAPGSDWLIEKVVGLNDQVKIDYRWGLDHGTWSVLHPMYPKADIPVVQLSLGRNLSPAEHYSFGQSLCRLREEGVLVLGSGNIVHNLRMVISQDTAFDWALEYDAKVKNWILKKDYENIIHYERLNHAASLAINSAEHYLPLLYILGASDADDPVKFYCERVTMGSMSMRCVLFG